jgi:hypothetical protein
MGFKVLEFGVPPLTCLWVLGLGYCTGFWSSYYFVGSFGHGVCDDGFKYFSLINGFCHLRGC